MASNFGAIGLPQDEAKVLEIFDVVFTRGKRQELPSSRFDHVFWRDDSGAALALHLKKKEFICATPYFLPERPTRWRVKTSKARLDPSCLHCSGAAIDVLGADDQTVMRAIVQWLYFAPYANWLSVERRFDLRIVAFARRAGFFETLEELQAATAGMVGEMRIGANMFLPIGMFDEDPTARIADRATALFAGPVRECSTLTNSATGERFHHLRVEPMAGPIDVVCPSSGIEGEPAVGRVALIDGWLVGTPEELPPAPSGLLSRLFGLKGS